VSADAAILGARVVTLDADRPAASAVAWRDGVIVAVGDDAAVREACDARTQLIDARGAVVTPGLVDAHIHPFHIEETRGADLTGCATLAEVNDRLARERRRARDEWVLGWGLEYGVFGDAPITGEPLTGAAGAPALLTFMDGHTAVATAAALERAAVVGVEQFAEGSTIVVDERGPTGELRELAAIERVRSVVPLLTDDELRAGVADLLRRLNTVGITGAHAMTGDPGTFDLVRELEAEDALTVRVIVPLWQKPDTPWDSMLDQVRLVGERGRLWRGGAAKFFIDGVIDTGTAWLFEPDTTGAGQHPFWPDPERYAAAVRLFAEHGFQCATHAVGDRAVAAALDAYRDAPATGIAHRIEHLETVRPQEIERVAAEGIAASMQPLHMQWRTADGSDSWASRLGPERTARAFPTASLLQRGTLLVLGSDWPVATYDPRMGMCWARFRTAPGSDTVFEPEQRLSGDTVLRGYTTNVARLVGESTCAGVLREGYHADITAFADDPRSMAAADLVDVPITLTVVDGNVVHMT
jgi:predicted amidohydrolase YtcJ